VLKGFRRGHLQKGLIWERYPDGSLGRNKNWNVRKGRLRRMSTRETMGVLLELEKHAQGGPGRKMRKKLQRKEGRREQMT